MRSLFVLSILAAAAAAQSADRFVTYTNGGGPSLQANVVEIDDTAAILRTLTILGGDQVPRQIVMNEDNSSYRVIGNDPFKGYAGFVYDITPGGLVTTIVHGFPLLNPFAILRADDGEWILFDRLYSSRTSVYRLNGSTLHAVGTIDGLDIQALAPNPANGRALARAWIAPAPPYVARGYFEIDLDTLRYTTLARPDVSTNINVQYGARRPLYRADVGDFLDPLYDQVIRGMEVNSITPGAVTPVSEPYFGQQPTDHVRAGGRAFPVEYHVFVRGMAIPVNFSIVQQRGTLNVVRASTQPASAAFDSFAPLLRIGSRHLTWFAGPSPTRRRLAVDFPGEGGRRYLVAFSATGLRPAFALGDGREVPIAFDGFTLASLDGGVPGVLGPTLGALDALGHADVTIDWTRFGRAASGLVLWAVAVVFDPAASSGVAHVSDPVRLRIP